MIMILPTDMSSEERAKMFCARFGLADRVTSIDETGFTINWNGYEPSVDRRLLAQLINVIPRIGDVTLVFNDITAGTYDETDRGGWDETTTTTTYSNLEIRFSPDTK